MIARACLLLLLLTGLVAAEPFKAVGRWRFFHTDGTPILVVLYPNHKAESDWGDEGEKGVWSWAGNRLVMRWKDGWRDSITLSEGRYEKAGYAPDNRDPKAPSNVTKAYRLD